MLRRPSKRLEILSPDEQASRDVFSAQEGIPRIQFGDQNDPNFYKESFPELRITQYAGEILDHLREKKQLVIHAPTGTGKTLFLGTFISQQLGVKVRGAIPNTVAVRAWYNFQKKHTHFNVGFAAGRIISYQKTTQVVFGTTGHFAEKLMNLFKRHNVTEEIILADIQREAKEILGDVFFIDEVHMATIQISILMGLVRKIFPPGSKRMPMLVFMTATANLVEIQTFFPNVDVFEIVAISHPVEVKYTKNAEEEIEEENPKAKDPSQEILRILRSELERWKESEVKYHGLIFRPGVQEIMELKEFMERSFPVEEPIEFFEAHSRLPPEEIDLIFGESSKMKVVIGTNIISSSITIDQLGFVIDDGLIKSAETSSLGGQRLELQLISKAEARQRAGRTGRTMPGRVYRLCSESFWGKLSDHPVREIDRIPIFPTILKCRDIGIDPEEVLLLDHARVTRAEEYLIQLKMLEQQGEKLVTTPIGKFVSGIPLSIENGLMIYHARKEAPEKFQTVIALASMLEVFGPGFFWTPSKKRDEDMLSYTLRKRAHVEEFHEKYRGKTDIHTLVKLYWNLIEFIELKKEFSKEQETTQQLIKTFSQENALNNKTLQQAIIVLRDLEAFLEWERVENCDNVDLVGDFASEIFARTYMKNRLERTTTKKGIVYMGENKIPYTIGTRSSFNKLKDPPVIIAGQLMEVVGQKGIYNIASIIVNFF